MGLQLSGSVQLEGNLLVTGSANSVFENISVTNRITANEINVQFVSSSIIYSSGSNRFGDEITDNHQFTGSVSVTGSLNVGGNLNGTNATFALSNSSVGNATNLNLQQAGSGDVAVSYLLTGTREWLVGVDNSDSDAFKINNITGTSDFNNSGLSIATTGDTTFSNSVRATSPNITAPSLGSGQGAFFAASTNGLYGLYIGTSNDTGHSFIQNTRNDGSSLAYNLFVQPNGGNVGIGIDPTNILHVNAPTGIDAVARFSRGPSNAGDILFGIGDYGGGNQCRIGAQQLAFEVNRANGAGLSTGTTAMFIDSSARVGIGTTTPASYARLDVAGTAGAQTDAAQQVVIAAPTTTVGHGAGLRFNAASGSKEAVGIIGMVNEATGNLGAMTFHTYAGGANIPEGMRITSGGNVGIGTDSPATNLHVVKNSSNPIRMERTGASGGFVDLQLFGAGGSNYFALGGDRIHSGQINDLTTASAANVFIGADSNGITSVLHRSTSSLKYKIDIRDYNKGLDFIQTLRPVYYKGKNDGNKQFAGLIAEEVHASGLEEFVQYAQDGSPDSLAYTHITALLINGIKELKAKIESLEAENDNLRSRLEVLEQS
jgi:hypothetical protein